MFENHAVTVDFKPNEWVVVRPLVWRDGDVIISVPERFVTDLASIPPLLRALPAFNPCGLSRRPAILHDYAYCMQPLATRKDTDQLFYDALLSVGVSKLIARLHWLGVRAGGWLYWNKRGKVTELDSQDFVSPAEFEQLVGGD